MLKRYLSVPHNKRIQPTAKNTARTWFCFCGRRYEALAVKG